MTESVEGQPESKDIWLRIEVTKSVPETDGTGAFVTKDGEMTYGPDESGWAVLHPVDVPGWVTENDSIRDLTQDVRISRHPNDNGRWYRATVCYPEGGSRH